MRERDRRIYSSYEIDVRIVDWLEHNSRGEVPGLVEIVLEERGEGDLAKSDIVGGVKHAVARGDGREVEERRDQHHRRRRRGFSGEQPLPHRCSRVSIWGAKEWVWWSEKNSTKRRRRRMRSGFYEGCSWESVLARAIFVPPRLHWRFQLPMCIYHISPMGSFVFLLILGEDCFFLHLRIIFLHLHSPCELTILLTFKNFKTQITLHPHSELPRLLLPWPSLHPLCRPLVTAPQPLHLHCLYLLHCCLSRLGCICSIFTVSLGCTSISLRAKCSATAPPPYQ